MRPIPPRRSSKDYLLPFLIIVALGVIAALLLQLWGLWSDDGESSLGLSGKAELNEISGEVEVFLPAASAWKITSESASLNPGESVRTGSEGQATLNFEDGSTITLAGSSELEISDLRNSITKKLVKLSLVRGSAVVAVGTMNADFQITSEFMKLHEADGLFLLTIEDDENTASVIEGGFVATILDPQNPKVPELENFVVETGETIEISERRVNLLRIDGKIDVVKTTPKEILNSGLYLAATNKAAVSETPEETLNPDEVTTDTERDVLPAPFVVTGGGNISAVTDPVKVSGKVSPKIVKVAVTYGDDEPFILSQFEANSGEWSYNAAQEYGNLEVGINNYSVVGYDEADNPTPVANFQIRFNPEGVEDADTESEEPATSNQEPATSNQTDGVPAVGESTFPAPTVSEPADGATFTEAPVHFEGTVPAGTAEVLVNEYKLASFTAGDTTWRYNADPKYQNLEEGENEYEIVAVNEAGDRSTVTVKITYQPVQE